MKYAVILNLNGSPVFLVNERNDDETALFDTKEEADSAGTSNPLGETFGFEILEWNQI